MRFRVGMIEEDNKRRDTQLLEMMKVMAKHRKIMAKHTKILEKTARALATHDRRFDVKDQILSKQKNFLKQLGSI